MTQYCRCCCYLVTGNGIYCWKREKEMSEKSTKRTNKCKDFAFNPLDAYDFDKCYQPRRKREKLKPLEYYDSLNLEEGV